MHIMEDGSLYCWENNYGQGGGRYHDRATLPSVTRQVGQYHRATEKSRMRRHGRWLVYCGDNNTDDRRCNHFNRDAPTEVGGQHGPREIRLPSIQWRLSYLCYNGHRQMECWGRGSQGQLGQNNDYDYYSPQSVRSQFYGGDIPDDYTATSIATGSQHTCLTIDHPTNPGLAGRAYCWGANTYGQLGNDHPTNWGPGYSEDEPQLVQLPSNSVANLGANEITAGSGHVCTLMSDGSVYCWGENDQGQLGDGTTDDTSTPSLVTLPTGRTATAITAG